MSSEQIVIASFKGQHLRPGLFRGEALEILKQVTGHDFGWDVAAWSEWLANHQYKDKVWHDAIWRAYRGRRLILLQSPGQEETFNPIAQQAKDAIEHLNIKEPSFAILRSSFGTLFMWSAEEDRVVVTFSGYLGKKQTLFSAIFLGKKQISFSAVLLDTNIDDPEGMITFKVISEREDVRKRCETVTKAVAMKVAAYFVEHDCLPNGFHWTEDVTPFLLVTDIHP